MFKIKLLFLLLTLGLCNCAFVDNLNKCKINDGACERDLVQGVLRDIAKTGVPELKIPPIDPIVLSNVSVSVIDLIDLTLVDGVVKGIKDCTVDKFSTDLETERAFMELTCDVSLKAHYKVLSESALIKTFLGGETVRGDGNLKLRVEKMHIRFDYFFYIQRRPDDIYIKCKRTKSDYEYDILGKFNVFLDNLYLGKQDASETVSALINQNWKFLHRSFGKLFMDKAMEYVYKFVHSFFENVPVKYYISEDLSKYARE